MPAISPPVPPTASTGTGGAAGSDPEQAPAPAAPPSRRSLLRAIGAVAGTVVVAGTGALGYRVNDTAVLDPGSGDAFEPWRRWREDPGPTGAVAAALLAANPHNTQPWQFEVTGAAVDVYVDPSRTTGSIDPFLREQHVGLGCALENLVLGCRARGLEPQVELLPDPTDPTWVAHLSLSAAAPVADRRYEAIGSRHTDRGAYGPRSFSPGELDELVGTDETARDVPGVQVHWVDQPSDMAAMGDLLVDAAVAVTADDQQSRDGFVWFRSDDDQVQRYADGLTLDAQGLSPLMLSAAKLLPASSRADGDTFWVQRTREVHTRTAAAYGVLTVGSQADLDDRAVQLEAGRLLQRIHLTATDLGVSLQHMNQVTERIDRELVTASTAATSARFARLLPPGSLPLVTFRVGHPTREALSSPRRGLAAVVR